MGKKLNILLTGLTVALAAETLIFDDEFDKLNFNTWQHE